MTVIDKERLARLAKALDNRAKALVKTEEDRAMIAEAVLDEKINNKQDKTDNNLNTEDKTIVGAINELESEVFDIAANVISMDAYKADKTYVDEQLSNITNNNITEAELDLLLEEIFGINSKNELTSVRLGNYQMKYDNVNDTLDFLYNGVIGEPMEEIIPLTWAVGNLSGTDGSEKEQENSLRSDFAAIEDNYDYSFYLDTSFYDPSGVRVYFYDTNKTYISRTDGNVIGYVSGIYISIDVPTNAAYMRFKANASGTTLVDTIGSLFTLRKRKTAIVNNYVTDGLSLYIDADDVATYGSVRDITGKQNITNHGVSTTLDNGCLNFVANESDYIDTGLVPNLTTWSAEVYFYFTETPGVDTQVIFGWGVSGSKVRIGYSDDAGTLIAQSNNESNYTIANVYDLLSPLHHLIVTMNNGALTSYLDGVKTVLCVSGGTQTSHKGTLKIGCKYNSIEHFANIHLKSLRFYDGKVLSDEEALQNYNYETKINNYVTNGLSLYIDAQDVATQGSIRDITGKQNIDNHGVSTTLDNGCLNFVASESDYIDCGFKPNLTQWSAEIYFYFTNSETGTLLGWGSYTGNRTAIAIWNNDFMIAINDDVQHTIMPTAPTSLAHLVLTYNNGRIIAYVNGVKSQITASANVMSSQAGNLMIGTKYSASDDFGHIHLKSLRFYDGKVLSDEEALQNYNYEINRCESIIAVTWKDGKSLTSDGSVVPNETAMITDHIEIDNNYIYTIRYNPTTTNEIRIAFYDSSLIFIARSDYLTSGNVDTVITFPENTAYFRIKSEKVGITVNEANDNIIIKKVAK